MRRFHAPIASGTLTLLSVAALLFVPDQPGPALLTELLLAATGAPITLLLVVRVIADPLGEGRSLWSSFLVGATLVPAIVIALHGIFLAIGFALVAPFAGAGTELLDRLRADPGLAEVLTTFWAYILIVELAIVAPLAEETTKPIGSLIRRPASGRDAFMFGAAAGAGFAVVENVMYAAGWFFNLDYWLSVSVMRILGAGLHIFGAALVSWGVFQWRQQEAGHWRRLGRAYGLAFATHALWNGTIAVTQVLYAGRSELEGSLSADALAWGVGLQAFLAGLGALIAGGLLMAAKRVGDGDQPVEFRLLTGLGHPAGIASWGLISTMLLIPSAILVLVFPGLVAL